MSGSRDIESGSEYKPLAVSEASAEDEALLNEHNSFTDVERPTTSSRATSGRFSYLHLGLAFVGGIFISLCTAALFPSLCYPFSLFSGTTDGLDRIGIAAPTHVGSTERHDYPPVSPTNGQTSLFPTDIGFAGPTPTGAEPAVVATAPSYPLHTGAQVLVTPTPKDGTKSSKKGEFEVFKNWGNLSPWYSVDRGVFGVDSSAEAPDQCVVKGLHFLHRHGARYPTAFASYGGPANFSARLHESAEGWNGTGELDFMNDWTYKLGEEILTPFGRQQLFDLGVSLRLKYGYLLKDFTESNSLPVFRTESQDRMLHSALNFAVGFFGLPIEGKYLQSVTIEELGYNNTLAPYKTCPNARDRTKSDRGIPYVREWASIYLKNAHARLAPQLKGYDLSIEDVYIFQQFCAYETVAIGYSKFCELFTEEEWEGFEYSLDLYFWYNSAFGSPVARVQGIGYIQELVARLTHTPIQIHNSSTNATLDDDPLFFPLDQSLYVDATHEVVILNILTALNLTSFAAIGPLPADHIPTNRSFIASQLAPFAANMQFQLLECIGMDGDQIRIILNDGVVPLTGIRGCPDQKDGMCPVDTFVRAQREIIQEVDWIYECHGDWTVPPGPAWNTTTGSPPSKPR
ncbi:phosphoglycerate mutase-like protein [Fomitiporia mediterranea MF3/22]|uniref:phosphoglycerate mutase-like protein n=1 Tax=Fomitiporia mediterranea (strain MF3/22) TaxID=694068 RepID=UPI00044072BE|nr:phosphoglycerate mutase-like protein [Fomitiporia mediterranea MF3/22]EJD02001.1 phosphoglycerate mutase-like protein [Fomitiporia mediterranea MF3/22]